MSFTTVCRDILKNEGVSKKIIFKADLMLNLTLKFVQSAGFFKGMVSPIVGVTPYNVS